MKRLRWTIAAFLFFFGLSGQAQQYSIYSQYIFNLYTVNPAYVGERQGFSAGLSYRAQWVGFEGAPNTADFYAHSLLKDPNMGVGLQVRNDRIGARSNTFMTGTYSYKVRFTERNKLSFGLSAGLVNHQYQWDVLEYPDGSDPIPAEASENVWVPTFDFGVMYVSHDAYVGASVMGLDGSRIVDSDLSDSRTERFINIMGGKIFEMGENFAVKPSGLIRMSAGGPFQFDANFGVRFSNALWLTGTYRYEFGAVFSAHYYVNDHFHFGYAYDLPTNELLAEQSGTHEIFIGFDLNFFPDKVKSPRDF